MATIEFDHVFYTASGKTILRDLSFAVEPAETVILLGRSGSGKTTCLKLMNGLLRPASGTILVEGKKTIEWDKIQLRRRFGYVLQEGGLFPHLTIQQNVGLLLEMLGTPEAERKKRVQEVLETVGLNPSEFENRYPHQLSGGQRQRVSVARALAADPPFLLLDEPFGALDPITRAELQIEFQRLKGELKKTIVFVTHDLSEAFLLGSRIAYFSGGRLIAYTEVEKFRHSRDPEIAAFVEPLRQSVQFLTGKL